MATTSTDRARFGGERAPAPQPVPRAILTRDGERALREELERLRAEANGELVERLREARDLGSSGDNDEYLQIQEEEAVLASRIRRLESLLDSAVIMEETPGATGMVAIGSLVDVKSKRSGKVRELRLTGGFDLSGPDDVSVNSPVGQALLGRTVGETVTVELPNGRTTKLEIVAVR